MYVLYMCMHWRTLVLCVHTRAHVHTHACTHTTNTHTHTHTHTHRLRRCGPSMISTRQKTMNFPSEQVRRQDKALYNNLPTFPHLGVTTPYSLFQYCEVSYPTVSVSFSYPYSSAYVPNSGVPTPYSSIQVSIFVLQCL